MTKMCMVEECRYNDTHTTRGHKCGRCCNFGHGILMSKCIKKRKINTIFRSNYRWGK